MPLRYGGVKVIITQIRTLPTQDGLRVGDALRRIICQIDVVLKKATKMKTRTIWALSLSLLFSPVISSAQARKRVVIVPFADRDASQGMDATQLMMLGTQGAHVGPRISDELISKLAT